MRCFIAGLIAVAACWVAALAPLAVGIPAMLTMTAAAYLVVRD